MAEQNTFIPSLGPLTDKAAYGGVKPMRMNAPTAPGANTAQGRANAGQMALPENLTLQAQQTMGVPSKPTKGLLPRAMPGFNDVRRMG